MQPWWFSPIDLRAIASYIIVNSKNRFHPIKELNAGAHNHADRKHSTGCVRRYDEHFPEWRL